VRRKLLTRVAIFTEPRSGTSAMFVGKAWCSRRSGPTFGRQSLSTTVSAVCSKMYQTDERFMCSTNENETFAQRYLHA
jgi:hypothetical protein